MEELTETQELENYEREIDKVNKKITKLTDFLLDINEDYNIESWDSGEGREVIFIGKDEEVDEEGKSKEYKIKFAFYNTGYISVEVEPKEIK